MACERTRAHNTAAALVALPLAALLGCGEAASPPPSTTSIEAPTPASRRLAAGFSTESWAIGASWYDYDSATHAVTPKPLVYVWRHGDTLTLFAITSYYDDRGESGALTLASSDWRDGAWTETRTLRLSGNIKRAEACLALAPLREVSCVEDASAVDLVARTSWRALPEAGFAVAEPALYATWQPRGGESPTLARVPAASVEAAAAQPFETLRALDPLPDAARTASDGLLGTLAPDVAPVMAGGVSGDMSGERQRRGRIFLQVNAHMALARWSITSIARDEDGWTLSVALSCQPVSLRAQTLEDAEEITVRVPATAPTALVQWCGEGAARSGEVVTPDGSWWRWPDTRAFDLSLEQRDGALTARVAPGNLLWSWSAAHGDEPVDPARIWSEGLP